MVDIFDNLLVLIITTAEEPWYVIPIPGCHWTYFDCNHNPDHHRGPF